MPFPPFKKILPGQRQLSARDLNKAQRGVENSSRIAGAGDVTLSSSTGGIAVANLSPPSVEIQITGAPIGAAYPWVEVAAGVTPCPGSRGGTATVNPARETSGNTGVAVGTITRAFLSPDQTGYLFSVSGGGGSAAYQDFMLASVVTNPSVLGGTFANLLWSSFFTLATSNFGYTADANQINFKIPLSPNGSTYDTGQRLLTATLTISCAAAGMVEMFIYDNHALGDGTLIATNSITIDAGSVGSERSFGCAGTAYDVDPVSYRVVLYNHTAGSVTFPVDNLLSPHPQRIQSCRFTARNLSDV